MQETQIATRRGVLYANSRAHVVFDDGSAIVLHPGGQFVTYYTPGGSILRQVSSCATYEVKERLLLALELYNSLSVTPVGIYGEQLYTVDKKDVKFSYFHWPVPNCISVLDKRDSRELRRIRLTDEEDLKLLRVFRSADGSLTIESLEQEARVTLSSSGMLIKVSFPMLLPSKKPLWHDKQGTVKLAYEYAKLTQVYSTAATPAIWQPVLKLLWICFLEEDCPVIREPLWIDSDDVLQLGETEIATPVPSAGTGQIWSCDGVSPAVAAFNYFEAPVSAVWTPEATYRRTLTGDMEVVIHQDQSVLHCSPAVERLVFRLYLPSDQLCFTDETVPPVVRTGETEYSLQTIVQLCQEVLSLPVKEPATQGWEDDDVAADGIKCESEHEGVGLFTAYNDCSVRVLFDDRTVVRLHRDMSISAISRQGEMAKLTLDNPFGFEQYIPVVIEFYDWVFSSPEHQAEQRQAREDRERRIAAETQHIQRLVSPPTDCGGFGSAEVAAQLAETERCLRELSNYLA